MIAGVEIKNGSCDPEYISSFRGGLSSKSQDLTQFICMQNLTILALAVPDMSLRASKFEVGHVTLTTPLLKLKMGHVTLSTVLLRVICHSSAGTLHSLPVYKIRRL